MARGVIAFLLGLLLMVCGGCGGDSGHPSSSKPSATTAIATPVPVSPTFTGTCSVPSCSSDLVEAFHVDQWFWSSKTVRDETIFPLTGKSTYSLWRPAISIEQVRNRQTGQLYKPNLDYRLVAGKIVIPPGSTIPRTKLSWLITADPTNPPLWQPVRKDGKALRIDAGGYQSRQIAVTYTSADVGTSPTASQVTKLMLAKLNARKPVNILFAGDSITEGDDSTAIDKQAPNQPGYAALATAYLAKLYPGQVTMNNVSAPGEGSAYFTKHLAAFSNPNTNVLVIGLGMNDPPGGVTTEQFRANIMALIMAQRAANPACEIILVASWPSNPDWIVSNNSQLGEYRAVEYSIANTLSDVFVADFSTTSLQILQKKTYADITGSGAAHPNDFMYVVFAQILLKTMLGI